MSHPVFVMGALGRMGTTLVRLVGESDQHTLAGVVVLDSQLDEADRFDCPVTTNIVNLLHKEPTATVIDFTSPETSLEVARAVAREKAYHVIGTTGFTPEQMSELEELAKQTPIFWAPNMSVGINTLLRILPELVELLGPQYDIETMEVHHNKKVDSPSGTAMRIAEVLAKAKKWNLPEVACYHREGIIGARPQEQLGIQTLRGGDVVGDHTVYFFGTGERISITHQASSRENFAQGALRASAWLPTQKPGRIYTMQDMLS